MVNLLSKIFKGRKMHTRWETREKYTTWKNTAQMEG
jgi:heme-degrading monooxygenase HmoA